ncbi:MAG: ROK family protein [Planctomycetota bacterium]
MDPQGPAIGIDLGGTNMQIGVVRPDALSARPEGDHNELIAGRAKLKTKAEEGLEAVIDRLHRGIEEACANAGIALDELRCLGIGAPGAIDPDRGVVVEAPNLRWNDVPLAAMLEDRLDIPCLVDNDVNVAVYGEDRLGAGAGSDYLLGVWCGTGVGGGLILDGKLYYGAKGTAGEIGHMLALPSAQPGSRSLEQNCSRSSIAERLVKLIRANQKSMITDLTEGRYDKIKSGIIGRAFEAGDELTVEVISEAAKLLGHHIAGIVTLLSLDRVVLGGGLTEALGAPWVEMVRTSTQKTAFPESVRGVAVVATALEDDAGLLGAALLGFERASQTVTKETAS